MTAGVATARDRSTVEVARAWMRDRPLVPLLLLLALLVSSCRSCSRGS